MFLRLLHHERPHSPGTMIGVVRRYVRFGEAVRLRSTSSMGAKRTFLSSLAMSPWRPQPTSGTATTAPPHGKHGIRALRRVALSAPFPPACRAAAPHGGQISAKPEGFEKKTFPRTKALHSPRERDGALRRSAGTSPPGTTPKVHGGRPRANNNNGLLNCRISAILPFWRPGRFPLGPASDTGKGVKNLRRRRLPARHTLSH